MLFLGAGVHAPPPPALASAYPDGVRPPTGAALSLLLADACGLTEDPSGEADAKLRRIAQDRSNLQRVSLFYEISSTRRRLVDAVIEAVDQGKRPSPMLRALAELPFPIVITTNYDQLFETALRSAGKRPRLSVYSPERRATTVHRNATADNPVLFKLHGDIESPESLVVTDEDYIQFVLRMSDKEQFDPVPLTLKFHLSEWTTLLVGYSLLDYNLRLLFKTLRWGVDSSALPLMYSVDYDPDPLILDVWDSQRRYVKFIAENVWSFVPQLYERVLGKECAS